MTLKSLSIVFVLVCCGVLSAQQKKTGIEAYGDADPNDRGYDRVLYWDQQKDSAAGEFSVHYGRPVWKKEYEDAAKFDGMTKGKVWRFGKDFWTVLDTNLPLKVGGKEVPVGSYYLGLFRSGDETGWSLAFIDPSKVRAARLDAFEINRAPILFKVPMTEEKPSGSPAEKLIVKFSYQKANFRDVTLRLSWGKLQLKVSIQVVL
jgi:hypothetical protein